MLPEPLDLTTMLGSGEEPQGYWPVSLVTPDGTVLSGTLLVSPWRLLFHAQQDHTHKGEWLEVAHLQQRFTPQYPEALRGYAVAVGNTAYLSIPRGHVTRVALLRGLIDRSVQLVLGQGYVITLRNAGFNAKKIVAALGGEGAVG